MLIILTSHKHASLLQNNSVLSKASKGSTTGGGSFKIRKSIYCTTPNLAKLFAHLLASLKICVTMELVKILIRFLQLDNRGSNIRLT